MIKPTSWHVLLTLVSHPYTDLIKANAYDCLPPHFRPKLIPRAMQHIDSRAPSCSPAQGHEILKLHMLRAIPGTSGSKNKKKEK